MASSKHAILVANAPGTIDPGYRGELRVILVNAGKADYKIEKGDRIAQLVVARYESVEWEEGELNETARGADGHALANAILRSCGNYGKPSWAVEGGPNDAPDSRRSPCMLA